MQRSPYGKIYWCSVLVVVFIYEFYLSTIRVEDPITTRIRGLIFGAIIAGLVVSLVWVTDRLGSRPLYHHLMPQHHDKNISKKSAQGTAKMTPPKYGKVFKLILAITTLIYSAGGAGFYKYTEYPLAFILASIIGGLASGSILGGVVILIMYIITRVKQSKR